MNTDQKAGHSGNAGAKIPPQELLQLDAFAGRWTIEGKNFPSAPQDKELPVRGEDHYTWLAGKFFMIDTWKHLSDGGGHTGISVLGFDDEAQKLFTKNFDNLGYERKYLLERDQRTWKFVGDTERAVREFTDDGNSYTEHWEVKNSDGHWMPLCVMTGTKA